MGISVPADVGRAEPRRVWSLVPITASLAVAAAAASLGLALAAGSRDPVQVFLIEWVAVPYVGAGVIAWWRRPASRLGPLMVAGGLASAFSGWQLAEAAGPYTFGAAFDIVPAALFLHVCLAFPDGRLRSRFEGALVGVAYASAVGLQLVKLALGGVDPANLIDVWRQPDLVAIVEDVQLLSLSACCLVGLGVLVRRRRSLGRPRRRSIAFVIDSFSVALVMIAALFLIATFDWPGFREVQRVTLFVVGLSPLAFLLGLLDARLARSAVGDLIVELRSEPPPRDLREPLAHALRDPSLTLAFWLPDFGTYVDVNGHPLQFAGDDDRAVTLIDRNGEHVAALVHDPALGDERQLLEAVSAAAGMSLENARLQAELQARVEELRGSRSRVIEAGQKERQRLERNLHDGAQQRLIALSVRLSLLEKRLPEEPAVKQELEAARRELALSLDELRDVARGIHPAVLSSHGLEIALESLSARAPLPVRLTIDLERRLPERVEVAAYYVVAESLTNIAKHAQATEVRVTVQRHDDGLVVEVVDNGIGGADTEQGSGLRGLADRVEALGGRLRVWTPAGGGTRVQAAIPCA